MPAHEGAYERMLTAVRAERLFDGLSDQPFPHRTVIINDGLIDEIVAGDPALPDDAAYLDTPILAPGFIDMQINGARGLLFNDVLTVETISAMAAASRLGGAAYILPTFITARDQAYREAIDTVATARDQDISGVLGIHLEGPFLSPKRPGIHDASAIRQIESGDLDHLIECHDGVRLITLAPEEQPAGTIQRLTAAGWTVFAGHSEASFDDMSLAADEGLRGITHLFNAMSQIAPRDPGLVGSAFDDRRLFAGIIADGHHVHPANLRLAVTCVGAERLCLVTDAMPTLGSSETAFTLNGKTIHLENGWLTDAEGTLAGAHLSMIEAVRNMVRFTGISPADALRMASTAPADALGLDKELGRIAPGFRAGLTLLDVGLTVQGVIADGHHLD